jgi:outer membrane protein TolC
MAMISPWQQRTVRLACILVLAAALGTVAGAAAAEPAVPAAASASGAVVDIDELVRTAVENNPAVKAARAAVSETAARSRIERTWSDPSLKTTWWRENAGAEMPGIVEVMLEQEIPFPGKLGAVGRVREAEEAAARSEAARAERDVTLRVRESAAEIGYLRAALQIAAGNRELLARLRGAGEAGYAAGRSALADVLRAQSQESQTAYDGHVLAELERTELARLNSLLSRPGATAVGRIELHAGRPLGVGEEQVQQLAADGREEMRLARAGSERAAAQRRLATFESLPGLMLGVGWMQQQALDAMEAGGQLKLEFGVSLPVLFGKNAARRDEARSGVERAAALERQALDEGRAEVAEAWFRLRNAERLIGLYRDALLPQARAALELADTWYRAGQGSFSDYVDAGALWYTFQLALARAGADREKYLARLEALAGRPLTAPGEAAGAPAPALGADAAWDAALGRLESARASFEGAAAARAGVVLAPDPARLAALGDPEDDGATAAEELFPEVRLADVEALAVTRSPRVLAARRSLRAALEQYGQVEALDDLLRHYAVATGSLMTDVGGAMGQGTAAVFPFPGLLALKGEIVAADARAALEDLERARRDALAEGRRLFFALEAAHRSVTLLGEIEGLLRQAVGAVQARYESGRGQLADLVRAEVDLAKNETELTNAAKERAATEAALRSVLALPRGAVLGLPGGDGRLPAVADASALASLALERRQELRRMRAMAERMERMLEMAAREVVQEYSLGLSSFENQPLTQAGTAAEAGAFPAAVAAAEGTATPVRAVAGRVAGYVRETGQRLAGLRQEIRAEEEATVAMVHEAWVGYDRAGREERLWGVRVAELTRLAGETQDRAYRAGTATLPEALQIGRAHV